MSHLSALFALSGACSRFRHLSQIASGIPLAEWLMMQIVRDPHSMLHALTAVLVTLGTAQLFEWLVTKLDTTQNIRKAIHHSSERSAVAIGIFLAIVAQGPHQDRTLVGYLADNERADDGLRPFGRTILRPPEQHIAGHRPLDPCFKTTCPIEQH